MKLTCQIRRFLARTFSGNSLHRIEFGPPKFQNLQIFHHILLNFAIFRGGATLEKHADPEKNDRNSQKSRANSRNLIKPFLRSRKR